MGGGGTHQVRVGHECQLDATFHHFLHVAVENFGEVAEGPKNGEARNKGCEAVGDADKEHIKDDVLMELVVAGERGHGGVASTEGEEDLTGGGGPDTELAELAPLGVDVEVDALEDGGGGPHLIGAVQRRCANQQDEDDEVGEGGCEVHHLPAGLDPIEKAEEVEGPGDGKAEGEPPGGRPHDPEAGGQLEDGIFEVDLGLVAPPLVTWELAFLMAPGRWNGCRMLRCASSEGSQKVPLVKTQVSLGAYQARGSFRTSCQAAIPDLRQVLLR